MKSTIILFSLLTACISVQAEKFRCTTWNEVSQKEGHLSYQEADRGGKFVIVKKISNTQAIVYLKLNDESDLPTLRFYLRDEVQGRVEFYNLDEVKVWLLTPKLSFNNNILTFQRDNLYRIIYSESATHNEEALATDGEFKLSIRLKKITSAGLELTKTECNSGRDHKRQIR